MTKKKYWRMETGNYVITLVYRIPPSPVATTIGDLCALARRRSGLELRGVARIMGVSHVTVLKREENSDPRLAVAWRGRGWRF
jgi:hypothetical protein